LLVERIEKLPYKHYRPAELGRIKGQERYRLLISSKKLNELINDTWDIINDYLSGKYAAKIKVDIDPLYLE
ncbi:MAG: hypothetical protein IKE38_00760, partial [Erysipelotrichaceae bacterium]|nr:hypothetical protein [Erysipelotrichaceae bacterium]